MNETAKGHGIRIKKLQIACEVMQSAMKTGSDNYYLSPANDF
jgi:hypothetical protein